MHSELKVTEVGEKNHISVHLSIYLHDLRVSAPDTVTIDHKHLSDCLSIPTLQMFLAGGFSLSLADRHTLHTTEGK